MRRRHGRRVAAARTVAVLVVAQAQAGWVRGLVRTSSVEKPMSPMLAVARAEAAPGLLWSESAEGLAFGGVCFRVRSRCFVVISPFTKDWSESAQGFGLVGCADRVLHRNEPAGSTQTRTPALLTRGLGG